MNKDGSLAISCYNDLLPQFGLERLVAKKEQIRSIKAARE
jgi:hypothetical protein